MLQYDLIYHAIVSLSVSYYAESKKFGRHSAYISFKHNLTHLPLDKMAAILTNDILKRIPI